MTDFIEVFTQNSIRITTDGGRIYIDPFQMKIEPKDAAFVLITHDHMDHFSPEDLEKVICADTIMVVPAGMADKAQLYETKVKQIVTVTPDEKTEIEGLLIETVPAYNKLKPFHPRSSGWVGYILTVNGERVYIAGDTDATDEAKAVKCDIALVPIGGTYTMDVKKAAELINIMKPKVAIPVHFGGIVGKPEDADTFAQLVEAPTEVVKKIQF
ncbi:MAG: MBL fold metallo-hydrolase [Lachnospiraceae bacterium]|nr:MBL fold metallo-hydrolase [Lachnospiraceae bacterium]